MENCEAMQALISRMLDEDLTAQEQRKLAEHLETCPDCRAVYGAFSALSGELRSDLAEPPESLRENVMGEIRRERIRSKNRRPWRCALAVAAMAAVVVGVHLAAGNRLVMDLSQSVEITASAQPFEAAAGGGMMLYAANGAVEEESAEAAEAFVAADTAALPVCELPELSREDFLASVSSKQYRLAAADEAANEAAPAAPAAQEPEPFARLILADGEALLRCRGEALYLEAAESGTLLPLDMEKSEFEARFGAVPAPMP